MIGQWIIIVCNNKSQQQWMGSRVDWETPTVRRTTKENLMLRSDQCILAWLSSIGLANYASNRFNSRRVPKLGTWFLQIGVGPTLVWRAAGEIAAATGRLGRPRHAELLSEIRPAELLRLWGYANLILVEVGFHCTYAMTVERIESGLIDVGEGKRRIPASHWNARGMFVFGKTGCRCSSYQQL